MGCSLFLRRSRGVELTEKGAFLFVAVQRGLETISDAVTHMRDRPETADVTGVAAKLLEDGADWITFTSASTVEHFHARFDLPRLLKKFPQTKLASIGPETSKALAVLGITPTIEAAVHSIEGLVEALES